MLRHMKFKGGNRMKRAAMGMAVLMLLLMTGMVWGQAFEKNSKIAKTFYASEETEIQISNKYGNIHVLPWEKDSVRIEIELTVRAGKESKVDRLFDMVDFDFTSTRYYIIARSVFHKNRVISDMTSQLFSSDNNIEINYFVSIPSQSGLSIDNKFGNIYSTDHYGKLDITLSNGDLKVNDIYRDAKISVEFGNVYINHINTGRLYVNYGDVEIGTAGDMMFEGKSANVNMKSIDTLSIKSRRDKFNIEEAGTFKGEMSFSYINIKNLERELILTTKYGEVNIGSLSEPFEFLNSTSEFTDIRLDINSGMAYDLDIYHDSKTTVKVPDGIEVKHELIDKNSDLHRTSAIVGDGAQTMPSIKITNRAGLVSITHK